jgi:histidinol-phosphate phosphatase family protein
MSEGLAAPAVFWDRDGVVNVSPGAGYVLRWEDFVFSPGVVEALRLCRERGYRNVLVTSQQGVGKGLMTQAELDRIHAEMQAVLAVQGAEFDGIYACTCLGSDPDCTCRKPSPELVQRAARDLGLEVARSVLVGDADRDIEMGRRAGVPVTVRVLEAEDEVVGVEATFSLVGTRGLAGLLEPLLTAPKG